MTEIIQSHLLSPRKGRDVVKDTLLGAQRKGVGVITGGYLGSYREYLNIVEGE